MSQHLDWADFSETDFAYAAGFFDGEGSISVCRMTEKLPKWKRAQHRIRATIGSSDLCALDLYQKFPGSHISKFLSTYSRVGGYVVYFCGVDAQNFLQKIYRYLKVKRKQAELAFEFPIITKNKNRPISDDCWEKREKIYHRLRLLNKKGLRC